MLSIVLKVSMGNIPLSYYYYTPYTDKAGFPNGSAGKESTCKAGDTGDSGSVPGLGRFPGGGNGNPLQYSCQKKFHGQRSLVGYSPWGRKELNTPE